MADVSRLTFWHKLGHWPIVGLSFIGNGSDRSHGTHRSHESTRHWTWEPGHARWPESRCLCSYLNKMIMVYLFPQFLLQDLYQMHRQGCIRIQNVNLFTYKFLNLRNSILWEKSIDQKITLLGHINGFQWEVLILSCMKF